MEKSFNLKMATKQFLLLFKHNKKLLITAISATIISIIISILIPLKTGTIIDSIIDNIKVNKNNEETSKIVNGFKPFIKEIETINYEALNAINKNSKIKDLIEYGLISKESVELTNHKNELLDKNSNLFQNINCYDCQNDEDYINSVNNIYKIIELRKNISFIDNKANFILKNITLVFILIILEFILHYITNLIMSKLSKEITTNIRSKINKKIFKLPLNYYDKNKQGNILSIIINDIENLSSTISTEIIEIINSIILFIGLLLTMFKLSTKLTLIILGIVPIIFIILLFNVIKSSKYFKEKQDFLGEYNDFILNSYNGFKTIKSYNQKEKFITKEKKLNKELYTSTWQSNFYGSLMQPIVEFSGNIHFLVVCVIGGILVINGKLTIGTLQAFLNYAKSFNKPLINIASTLNIFEETLASTERIFTLLDSDETSEKNDKHIQLIGDISFNNVCFSYSKKKVLNNINLLIKKGEKIAIVGETGSGKTTLIKLLLGFYETKNGNITINGQNINNINPKALHTSIGVVLQDSWIFNGTISENISYGSKNDLNLIKKASVLTNLDDIVNKLPDNYNFLIDNNKNNLSKGEKQLISIARLFMKDKEIIILDEATSNIDIETENAIKNAIHKLTQNKTCLIIAHRLSTIINSDRIIVMNKGKIIEEGTHKELLKLKGNYYKMYKNQFQ